MPFFHSPQAGERSVAEASRLLVQELGRLPVFSNWGSAYKKMAEDKPVPVLTIGDTDERPRIPRRAINGPDMCS
jgi:hypothetical protein